MIHLAARASWKRAFAIACLAVAVAFALTPEPRKRVIVTDTTVTILDEVTFVGDTISTPSLHTLDAVAETMIANPSIALIEVQHSTLARAQAMVDYLVGQGVEPARLTTGTNGRQTGGFLIVQRASDEISCWASDL